ncbi:BCCT family transporter [Aestuariimicrobium sp. p3-SID1156]|uniref:BCCT family transporter n=1 Tax=Aestuariimicrobium sp. p3-SID1156 TaxID=2916038 RepID=UPI00223B19CF|nr:BCCT family transporter [Aestuariimicrobium sp. p3-SID1156]MCT1459327.1 BCCT family transporter [Aestuariimicrobium sp. p3-SID1156]
MNHQLNKVSPRVFWPSAGIIAIFVAAALIIPGSLKRLLTTVNGSVVNGLGWYYVLIVVGFVAVALYAAFSRYGEIKLGREEDAPRYSLFTWFSMLFAAGMGIGLVFWGVAEPLVHFASPPPGSRAQDAPGRAQEAMTTTFLHWGVHAWAIYIVIGLAVAFASHRKGRPMSMRWMLEPLFGDRVKGVLGDVIDITAVVGTLFGVATSLGFGVTQFAAGLEHLGVVKQSIGLLVILVAVITAMVTLSVSSGLDRGIKWLSNSNLVLAGILMIAVLLLGEPLFVLREFVQSLGEYIQNFIHLSFRTMPYRGEEGEAWLGGWTTYYWGWWMSWSPFVGVFIARISRGRTVREFILGVMLVPTLLTFLWFSVLGGTALWREVGGGGGLVGKDGEVDTTSALFDLLATLPGSTVLIGLFMLLIVVFFVTSSDSASFVVDMIAHGGNPNPPLRSRVFWAVAQGTIAAALLWVGSRQGALTDGLSALQTMAILVAAPFSVVMVLTSIATIKALHQEHRRRVAAQERVIAAELERQITTVVEEQLDGATTASR